MTIPAVFATKASQIDAGNVKSIFTSTTFWGAIIGLLSTLFPSIYTKLGLTSASRSSRGSAGLLSSMDDLPLHRLLLYLESNGGMNE